MKDTSSKIVIREDLDELLKDDKLAVKIIEGYLNKDISLGEYLKIFDNK
jgi:hypothetical protein